MCSPHSFLIQHLQADARRSQRTAMRLACLALVCLWLTMRALQQAAPPMLSVGTLALCGLAAATATLMAADARMTRQAVASLLQQGA